MKCVNMNEMSVEIRTPPSLGFWPNLVISSRLHNGRSDSSWRLSVRMPQPTVRLQPPRYELGPRSQEQNIFPYCENPREEAQANMCVQRSLD